MIKQQRQESPHVLVLDAGDSLIGDRTPASSSQGQSSIESMNAMGYDAMALGEGDLSKLGVDVVRQRIQEADFPILSANAFVTGTDKLLTQPYVILQMDGHRVAIIGLTGAATLADVEIRDPLQSVREVIDQVREQADITILLSHAGLSVNHQIAIEIQEIDLIVSGGGQGFTSAPQFTGDGPVVVHADSPSPGHAGRRIGVGTWTFDVQGQLVGQSWNSIALGANIPDDPDMRDWVQQHP